MAKRRRKRAPRRRRRRSNPAPVANPRRRRRRRARRRTLRGRARAATRRGKFLGGFVLDPMAPWPGMLARLAGKITVAWCVRRWGDPETDPTSATTGQAWSFKNYFIALLSSYLGGELVSRMVGAPTGAQFYVGGVDMTATKLMWSELVHRWPAAAQALGSGGMGQADDFAVLASQATEGDVLDDGAGNRYLLQGGKWVAMMGADGLGQVTEADYLGDGLGQVTEADYLGQVTEADYLGHVMPPTDSQTAQLLRRGSADPYHAAYL